MNFNKKFLIARKIGIFVLVTIVILSPAVVSSAGLVPCDGSATKPCNYQALITLADNIIDFLLQASVVVALLLFTYAGFLLAFSGGDTGEMSKAKAIFWNVVVGLVIALAAWLIIDTILSVLLKDESFKQYIPL